MRARRVACPGCCKAGLRAQLDEGRLEAPRHHARRGSHAEVEHSLPKL
jgi:hypothetical protein